MDAVKSAFIWFGAVVSTLIFLPLVAITRLFDRDPALYYTGRLFRLMGRSYSRLNPNWKITITGNISIDDRNPYVIVCNHQSLADIPLICNLPWEMKWVAKEGLFKIPIAGWMMRMAGDIPVVRRAKNQKEMIFSKAEYYLNNRCSVIFFPEGTRSRNGKLRRFTPGCFELAIEQNVPILPLAIEGTQNTLPRDSWKFGKAENIRLEVLEPVNTEELNEDDTGKLVHKVRTLIGDRIAAWRNEETD